jgi:hypothetical protein
LSRIACLFFATASTSHCSISIALRCVSTIVYTSMACYIFNYTFVNSCSSCATTFSSLTSFYIVCASTKWCSSTLSSFDSSMHTRSIDVALGLVCSLACQGRLLLCKNSTTYVLVISMFWIIVYVNCIFSLYAFLSTHFEDDDECGDDLITNGWIFNTPLCSLQLLFYFYSSQQFCFLFLPSSVLTPLRFLFPYYLL